MMNVKKLIFEGEGVTLDFKKNHNQLRKNSQDHGFFCQ